MTDSSLTPIATGGVKPPSTVRLNKESRSGVGLSKFAHLLVALSLSVTSTLASAQQPGPPSPHQEDPFTISVHVNMVVLHASVFDHKNLRVSGLDKGNFQIKEDGVPQQIKYFSHDDVPVTVGLVIDNSGSMGPKRSAVFAAALAFARSSNPDDQMFVVNFNEKVSLALPDGMLFTDNVAQLELALSRIVTSGQTALYDAVYVALNHLARGSRDKKVLIVISDGGDNASKHKLDSILAMAKRSDAIIYCVGIFDEQNGDRNPGVLKRIAEETGGETFLPESVKDLLPVCERIARDIRSQYTLAYVPSNSSQDGAYRVVQSKADLPGRGRLSVRTRTGYFAPTAATGVRHELH
jgi:VWFA-related protein